MQGGLGNQLFQYAAGLAIKEAIPDRRVVLTPLHENKHSSRDYRLCLYHRLPFIDSEPQAQTVLSEAYVPWDPSTNFLTDVVLRGYFQYLPAIQSIVPMLRPDILDYLVAHKENIRLKYSLINLSHLGFIHIRRGDYLLYPKYHIVQPIDYYEKAFSHVPDVSRWLILSDDPKWCKTQSCFSHCEVIDEPDEMIGLALMSMCHGGAIIANSTYSWWGAMLGASEATAPVVYPSRWSPTSIPNLFPTNWIAC